MFVALCSGGVRWAHPGTVDPGILVWGLQTKLIWILDMTNTNMSLLGYICIFLLQNGLCGLFLGAGAELPLKKPSLLYIA